MSVVAIRPVTFALLVIGLCVGPLGLRAGAEEPTKKPKPLVLAGDEEAAEALGAFKEAWKAKGLKGDDRVSQRDYAMRGISRIQHPAITKALGKASRSRNADVRMIALIYLGDQKALPHLAGQYALDAMRKHKKDVVLLLTGLQTLGELKYLGARSAIRNLLKHKEFVIRKAAIATVGRIGDKRMLGDVLRVLGMKLTDQGKEPEKKSGGKEVTEEGYSWDGVEVHYDTGSAGDGDQKMAEKLGKAQLAKNKAAAQGGKGGNKAGGVAGVGGSGGRGGSARSTQELIPTILRTLKALTGEEFDKPGTIRTWLRTHRAQLAKDAKALDAQEKAQKAS